ncbi:hypothetical protein GCM10008934_16490 [Virgibacillus salarius]|uniref:hypothetical protein n=1 Tax=Virgibacillus salarius TaxID=447199 RepID=UPI0031E3239E
MSITDISTHVKDGRDAIRSGLKELEEHGYIIRFDVRDLQGKILGNIIFAYDTSQLEKKEEIIAEAKFDIIQKLKKMSSEEIEALTSSGLSETGKSNTSIINKNNNKSNMCMNGSPESDNNDKLNASKEKAEIMEEVYKGCIKIDEPGFFNEIYTMLTRKFKGQLDARIIELAFSRYLEKQADLYNGNEIEIINPAGWFYDVYRDAIKIYKAQRYANNKEKEQIAKELKQVQNMHFSQKDKDQ